MTIDDPKYLFVYGTLLASAQHSMGDLLRDKARLVGPGSIQARLYIIDDPDDPGNNAYPGALPSGNTNDRVHGELYEIHDPDGLLEAFDDYEACSANWPEPHEFLRRKVTVDLANGSEAEAISYLYSWDVSTARAVPSGRYTEVSPSVR